jgi:hypothetical protein
MPPWPPAQTFNQQLFDAMVRHQIGLLMYSSGLRNRIWKLLDATEADVRQQIENRLRGLAGTQLTPARLKRADSLLQALSETRLDAWKDVRALWFEEMRTLATTEPSLVVGIMDKAIPVDLGMVVPDVARLRTIVTAQPFMGKTLKQWADDVSKGDVLRMQQQIRIGLTQGEAVPDIAKRLVGTVKLNGVDGVFEMTRRHAASVTRTAVNGIASEARALLFAANKDLAPEEMFLATLDSRTTPICRSLDGNVYPVGEGPRLPLHFNERSLYNPIIDGVVIGDRPFKAFSERGLLREFAKREGFDAPTVRADLPHGTKGAFDAWARGRMRELTGTVPAKTTYQAWLSKQSAKLQDDILGPTRGKLFRSGGLTLDRFVEPDGRTITLAELAEFDAQAFKDAGLDPDDFL